MAEIEAKMGNPRNEQTRMGKGTSHESLSPPSSLCFFGLRALLVIVLRRRKLGVSHSGYKCFSSRVHVQDRILTLRLVPLPLSLSFGCLVGDFAGALAKNPSNRPCCFADTIFTIFSAPLRTRSSLPIHHGYISMLKREANNSC